MPHKTEKAPTEVETLLISYGAPGVTRTRDPRLRRPLLYPTELRAQKLFTAPNYTSRPHSCQRLSQQLLPAQILNERVENFFVARKDVAFGEVVAIFGKAAQLQIERAVRFAVAEIKNFLVD